MTAALILHANKDLALALSLQTSFAESGLHAVILGDLEPGLPSAEALSAAVERYGAIVVVVSKNSAADLELMPAIEVAAHGVTKLYTARFDATDLSAALSFYLKSDHWADIDVDNRKEAIAKLARAIIAGKPLSSGVGRTRKRAERTRRVWLGLMALLFVGVVVSTAIWVRGQKTEAAVAEVELARLDGLLTPEVGPDISIHKIRRLTAMVFLQLFDLQEQDVEAALYSGSAGGVMQLLGRYNATPKTEYGAQRFEFFVAADPPKGVFCLIYNRMTDPNTMRRQYLLQEYPPVFPDGTMIDVGIASPDTTCDSLVQGTIDPSLMAEVEAQSELERITKSHTYLKANGVVNKNGSGLLPKALNIGGTNYGGPVSGVTYYFFEGGPDNWQPLAKFSGDEVGVQYFGRPPADLLLCIDTYVEIYRAHLSTMIVAKKDPGDILAPYTVVSQSNGPTLSREKSDCERYVGPGQAFASDISWTAEERVLPPDSGGTFDTSATRQAQAAARSGTSQSYGPVIAGMSLGMDFEAASAIAEESVASPRQTDKTAFQSLLYDDTAARFTALMQPDERSDIRYFVNLTLGYGIAVAPSHGTASVGSVWLAYRPNIMTLQVTDGSFSFREYRIALVDVYGPPDEVEILGGDADSEERLRLSWSGGMVPACKGGGVQHGSDVTTDAEGRQGMNSYSLDLTGGAGQYRCIPHLSALRMRRFYNAVNLLWLHESG